MHISHLDQHLNLESPIHRLDGRIKLIAVLAFVLACSLTPPGRWGAFAALGAVWVGATALARVPHRLLLRRGLVALPFALAALTLLFTRPGEVWIAMTLGGWQVHVTDQGFIAFLSVMLKSWLSALMALWLTATTSYPALVQALRGIGVPRLVVAIIAFMYRYLFVLADEAQRLLQAREARSARRDGYPAGGSILWRARVAGGMVGSLFLRSYERSERIYQAMVSRGYAGELRTLEASCLRLKDVAVFLGFVCLLGVIEGLAHL
ncbi:MAG: cobalt ECF transporter T component CbiQ [Anaerolineae bacterium]|nr:cobalt ECF transporter T component CbiQ [Anaerolineae bacterium]MDW8100221.1 cobalt ECF transporter T component CbiQ [Anaerolineae bacterium]